MNGPPGQPAETERPGSAARAAPPTERPRPGAPRVPGALPDPAWHPGAETCLACGYSLAGLATRGECPECGAAYSDRYFVVAGIPNSMRSTPPLRRLAWIAIISIAVVLVYGWFPLSRISWFVPAAMFAAAVAGAAGLHATGPRERHGTERFYIGPAGITRVAMTPDKRTGSLGSVHIPWEGCNGVHVKRIGPFWKRLRVGVRSGDRFENTAFDAGVRCPDQSVAEVVGVIKGFMGSGPPAPAPAPPAQPLPPAHGFPPNRAGEDGGHET